MNCVLFFDCKYVGIPHMVWVWPIGHERWKQYALSLFSYRAFLCQITIVFYHDHELVHQRLFWKTCRICPWPQTIVACSLGKAARAARACPSICCVLFRSWRLTLPIQRLFWIDNMLRIAWCSTWCGLLGVHTVGSNEIYSRRTSIHCWTAFHIASSIRDRQNINFLPS